MNKDISINELMSKIKTFCDDRDWEQYHNPKDLAIGITTEASELLDIFRFKSEDDMKKMLNDPEKKKEISKEVIDVLYFTLRFAQMNDIDISSEFKEKMKSNEIKYPIEKFKGSNMKYNE